MADVGNCSHCFNAAVDSIKKDLWGTGIVGLVTLYDLMSTAGQSDSDPGAGLDSMMSSFASLATDASNMSNSHEQTASGMVMTNSWLDAVHGYSELEADSSAIFSSQHGTVLVECVNWATHDTGRPESPLVYDASMDVRYCRHGATSCMSSSVAMLQRLILLRAARLCFHLTEARRDALVCRDSFVCCSCCQPLGGDVHFCCQNLPTLKHFE